MHSSFFTLYAAVAEHHVERASQPEEEREPNANLHRPLVMVVDDDEDVREVLSDVLKDAGYDVEAFEDGGPALSFLHHALLPPGPGYLPSLVILDVVMRGVDGQQFWIEKQGNPKLRDIPVLIISGLSRHAALEWVVNPDALAEERRSTDTMQKPIALGEFLEKVRRHVGS